MYSQGAAPSRLSAHSPVSSVSLCHKHGPVNFARRVQVCLSKFKCRLVVSPNLLFLAFVIDKCKLECHVGVRSCSIKIYLSTVKCTLGR